MYAPALGLHTDLQYAFCIATCSAAKVLREEKNLQMFVVFAIATVATMTTTTSTSTVTTPGTHDYKFRPA